jgi:hypothetical protein
MRQKKIMLKRERFDIIVSNKIMKYNTCMTTTQ